MNGARTRLGGGGGAGIGGAVDWIRAVVGRGALDRVRGVVRGAATLLLPLLFGVPALGAGPAIASAQSTHVLVVTGLGGAPEYSERFGDWGRGMVDASVAAGVPESNVTWLAERGVAAASGEARREAVAAAVTALVDRSSPGDLVVLALFGHGSARGDEVRLNLPGPDLTAEGLATLLDPLDDRRVVVVNAASASGGFVPALSAPGRVVITATRSTREDEATRFGGPFVAALRGDAADTDKDGRVSFLEAFEFARLEVARAYADAGQLPTEHPLLDDNGDGRGTLEPAAGTGRAPAGAEAVGGGAATAGDGPPDGRLAAAITLAPRAVAGDPAGSPDDSTLAALRAEEARLQAELAELRARRETMDAEAYQAALEALLLDIARNGRAIREAEGGGG